MDFERLKKRNQESYLEMEEGAELFPLHSYQGSTECSSGESASLALAVNVLLRRPIGRSAEDLGLELVFDITNTMLTQYSSSEVILSRP